MGELSDNFKELTLDSDIFEDAKNTFEVVLQKLLKNMTDSRSEAGSITLKIDVEMITMEDKTKGEEIRIPAFEYKVNSQMAIKNEQKGSNNPNMELVFDKDKMAFVLQYIDGAKQRTVWDVENDAEENETALLEDKGQYLIESKEEENTWQ